MKEVGKGKEGEYEREGRTGNEEMGGGGKERKEWEKKKGGKE